MIEVRIRRSWLRGSLIGAVLLAAVFGVGSALADHDAEVIRACASKSDSLRLVDSASDCRSNEEAVEWSREGAIPTPQACPSGQFVTGIDEDGHLLCATPTGTGGGDNGGGGGGGGTTDACGDGVQGPSEACDDGNTANETGCPYGQASCTSCNSTCTSPLHLTGDVCGDGNVNAVEQCDDGNPTSGDGCSATCTLEE